MKNDKIKESVINNISLIRRKTGLNQENFFDAYEIGKYFENNIKTQQGKADCISKFENGKKDLPLALLPVYAQIGKCSIEDILGVSGTELSFKEKDPVNDAVQLVCSSAYNACRFLFGLYEAEGINFKEGESGEVLISIQTDGGENYINGKQKKGKLINHYLNSLNKLRRYEEIDYDTYSAANERKLQLINEGELALADGIGIESILSGLEQYKRRDSTVLIEQLRDAFNQVHNNN